MLVCFYNISVGWLSFKFKFEETFFLIHLLKMILIWNKVSSAYLMKIQWFCFMLRCDIVLNSPAEQVV